MAREVKSPEAAMSRTKKPVAPVVVATSDGLENVVSGMGTARDKRSYSQYAIPVVKNRQELENIYRQSWLAKRIINVVAEDMTREWLTVKFDDKNKDNLKAVEKAATMLKVQAKTCEVLRWARLYGGAVIIIGIKGQDLLTPLDPEKVGKGQLQYLHVLDRWRLSPSHQLTTDLSSPNFGLPEYYTIAESTVNVHHSRILRFNGQPVPYFVWTQNGRWDDPELQHIFDSLMNCDTSTQAVASMMFEATVDTIQVQNLTQLLASKGGEAQVVKRFQLGALMKSFNRVLLLSGDETYTQHTKQFTNLDKIMEKFMVDVSGAAEIPMTRLFGQSAAGLNATGDNEVRNYYDAISNKQEAQLHSQMEYLYRILALHTLGKIPDDFEIEFNPLWQMSKKDEADIRKTQSDTDKTYLEMGVITEGMIARELKARGTYTELTDEDVELAEELTEFNAENRENGLLGEEEETLPGQETDPEKAEAVGTGNEQ